MIIANKISKKFDNKNILNDFNYKFNDTGLYLIVGENGSGKTTLLNIISGLVTPDDGSIIYNNVICNKKEYEYLRREEISYIFQNTNLINSLSVRDNLKIAYLTKYKNIDGFESSSSEILEKLYLSDRIDQKVKYLSGGEKERITIARALIKESKVILADEPTSALDYSTAEEIYDLLFELSKSRLVIIVSHDEEYIEKAKTNKNISIIDMNNKENYHTTYEFDKKEMEINNKKIPNANFMSKLLLSNYKFLNLLLIVILSILISVVMLSFNYSYFEQDKVISYMENQNLHMANLSTEDDSYEIPVSVKENSNVNVLKSYELDKTTNNIYTYGNSLAEDSIFQNYISYDIQSIFSNVILTPSLEDNHIILTSLIYDYLNEKGYIDENTIDFYYFSITIDSVVEREYSYKSDPTVDESFEDSYYTSAMWANYNTITNIQHMPQIHYEIYDSIIDGYSSDSVKIGSRFYSFFRSKTAQYSSGEFKIAENEENFVISDDEIVLPSDYVDGNYEDYIGNKITVSIPGLETKEYTIKDFSNYYNICLISDNNYKTLNEYYLEINGSTLTYDYLIDISTCDSSALLRFLNENNLYLYFGSSSLVYFDIESINLNFSYLFELKNKSIIIYFIINIFVVLIFNILSHKNTCLYLSLGIRKCEIYKYKFIGLIKSLISAHILGSIIFAGLSYYYSTKLIKASTVNFEIEYLKKDAILICIVTAVLSIFLGLLINIIMPKKIYSSLSEE